MSYFYGVYPAEKGLSLFWSLIQFVVEPDAIRLPHITLRGPYSERLNSTELNELNNKFYHEDEVFVTNPVSFFSREQNTVGLGVELGDLRIAWHKPDYPMGDAHVTLYDGENRRVAIGLLEILQAYSWRMRIGVTPIQHLEPKLLEKHGLLRLMVGIDRAYEQFQDGTLPSFDRVPYLSIDERLRVVRSMVERAGVKPLREDARLIA